jgi:hypothetical protein
MSTPVPAEACANAMGRECMHLFLELRAVVLGAQSLHDELSSAALMQGIMCTDVSGFVQRVGHFQGKGPRLQPV